MRSAYVPRNAVKAATLEKAHGVDGKYTQGLMMTEFCGTGEDEDPISIGLSAVSRLMYRYNVKFEEVGMMYVGSESLLDRAKSIKSNLMMLFNENNCYDVEGCDTYNACYGGTAALLNCMNWLTSDAWDGRWAIAVATDIADSPAGYRFMTGCACVAMLVGVDAALVFERERCSHIINRWDFYKVLAHTLAPRTTTSQTLRRSASPALTHSPPPLSFVYTQPWGWHIMAPIVDGPGSIDVYYECLDGCQRGLMEKRGVSNVIEVSRAGGATATQPRPSPQHRPKPKLRPLPSHPSSLTPPPSPPHPSRTGLGLLRLPLGSGPKFVKHAFERCQSNAMGFNPLKGGRTKKYDGKLHADEPAHSSTSSTSTSTSTSSTSHSHSHSQAHSQAKPQPQPSHSQAKQPLTPPFPLSLHPFRSRTRMASGSSPLHTSPPHRRAPPKRTSLRVKATGLLHR